MYFVDAGRCRYIGEDRCIAELSEGDFFGETAFVNMLRIMLEIEGGETVNDEHYAKVERERERETETERERERERQRQRQRETHTQRDRETDRERERERERERGAPDQASS